MNPMNPMNPFLLYSILDAAKLVGVSKAFLQRQIRLGNLRAIKLGRLTRITPPDLKLWIDQAPQIQIKDAKPYD